MLLIKLLGYIWPFIKEMLIGKRTLKDYILYYKERSLWIILISFSLALNVFTITTIIKVSKLVASNSDTELSNLKPNKKNNVQLSGTPQLNSCPLYVMPMLPVVPEIPLTELNTLKKDDYPALLELDRRYIMELLNYNHRLNKLMLDTYTSYLHSCTGKTSDDLDKK